MACTSANDSGATFLIDGLEKVLLDTQRWRQQRLGRFNRSLGIDVHGIEGIRFADCLKGPFGYGPGSLVKLLDRRDPLLSRSDVEI